MSPRHGRRLHRTNLGKCPHICACAVMVASGPFQVRRLGRWRWPPGRGAQQPRGGLGWGAAGSGQLKLPGCHFQKVLGGPGGMGISRPGGSTGPPGACWRIGVPGPTPERWWEQQSRGLSGLALRGWDRAREAPGAGPPGDAGDAWARAGRPDDPARGPADVAPRSRAGGGVTPMSTQSPRAGSSPELGIPRVMLDLREDSGPHVLPSPSVLGPRVSMACPSESEVSRALRRSAAATACPQAQPPPPLPSPSHLESLPFPREFIPLTSCAVTSGLRFAPIADWRLEASSWLPFCPSILGSFALRPPPRGWAARVTASVGLRRAQGTPSRSPPPAPMSPLPCPVQAAPPAPFS